MYIIKCINVKIRRHLSYNMTFGDIDQCTSVSMMNIDCSILTAL